MDKDIFVPYIHVAYILLYAIEMSCATCLTRLHKVYYMCCMNLKMNCKHQLQKSFVLLIKAIVKDFFQKIGYK
jgi:hypothetical protein